MQPRQSENAGEGKNGEVRIGLCVHGCFATGFVAANRDAIRELATRLTIEIVVTESTKPLPAIGDVPVRPSPAHGLDHNAALLAAPRHSRADYVMWCDAGDRLRPESIATAAALLDRDAAISAVVGGMVSADEGFRILLSPPGVLLRREAGLRFVRVHEYGLVANYETLAQLRHAGPLAFQPEPLSAKERIAPGGYWRMSLRDMVFERSRSERYAGYLRLYDPLTLEHYLADAEHFLVQHVDCGGPTPPPRSRIFAKQAALYAEAARQAEDDGEATCALLFATREQVVRAALDANEAPGALSEPETEWLRTRALAEQVGYLAAIFATSRIQIEDHPTTRILARFLPPQANIGWRQPAGDADLSSTLWVFATDTSHTAFRDAQQGEMCFSTSIERLADILASPLAALRR